MFGKNRKHQSEFVRELKGFARNRKTGEYVSLVALNKVGNAYSVVYRDCVRVGNYTFTESLHAMEQTEFNINFNKVRTPWRV